MLRISKEEAKFLQSNGIRHGENGLSRTTNGTYYVCECPKCMNLIRMYHGKPIIELRRNKYNNKTNKQDY